MKKYYRDLIGASKFDYLLKNARLEMKKSTEIEIPQTQDASIQTESSHLFSPFQSMQAPQFLYFQGQTLQLYQDTFMWMGKYTDIL